MNETKNKPTSLPPSIALLARQAVGQLRAQGASQTAPQERFKAAPGSGEPVQQQPAPDLGKPDDDSLDPHAWAAYERRRAERAHQEEAMSFFRQAGVSLPVLAWPPFSEFLEPAPGPPPAILSKPTAEPRPSARKRKPAPTPPPRRKVVSFDPFDEFRSGTREP